MRISGGGIVPFASGLGLAVRAERATKVVSAANRVENGADTAAALNRAEEAASATADASRVPDFLVSPGGDVIPVPKASTGPTQVVNAPGRTTGTAFTGGSGGNGLDSRVSDVRVMNPTPPKGASPGYPNGYVTYQNKAGQGVNPQTGRTVPNSDPSRHIPLSDPPRPAPSTPCPGGGTKCP